MFLLDVAKLAKLALAAFVALFAVEKSVPAQSAKVRQDAQRMLMRASAASKSHFDDFLEKEPTKELYCFAILRPKSDGREATAPLLARQLAAACDGWSFFSTEADEAENVHQAFTKEAMRIGVRNQMREMVMDGVWNQLADQGVLKEYRWLLKVDPDTFVRPSALRRAFARYPANFNKVVSASNLLVGPNGAEMNGEESRVREPGAPTSADENLGGTSVDGFFIAIPTALARRMARVAATGSALCDSLASGHNSQGMVEIKISERLCAAWSSASKPSSTQNKDGDEEGEAVACKQGMPLPAPAAAKLRKMFGSDGKTKVRFSLSGESFEPGLVLSSVDGQDVVHALKSNAQGLLKMARVGSTLKVRAPEDETGPSDPKCLWDIGAKGVEFFMDAAGNALLAMDPAGDSECTPIAQQLLNSSPRDASHPGEQLCEKTCPLGGHARAVCVSADFAVVHAVKDPSVYEKMVEAFP